jgi:hypothetical protein
LPLNRRTCLTIDHLGSRSAADHHRLSPRFIRKQPTKRTVFLAKIVEIRLRVHFGAGCALNEIVWLELAAVPVKIVAQPGAQRPRIRPLVISAGTSGCALSAAA